MRRRSLGVALAAIALGAVTVVPANADPAGNPVIEIRSVALGKCMEPRAASGYTAVVVAECTGSAQQRWEKVPVANGRVLLRNLADRRCAIGFTLLAMWPCAANDTAEQAELVPDTAGTVKVKVAGEYADTSIDPTGAMIDLASASDSDQQRWQVTEVGRIIAVDTTGKVVRIASVYERTCVGPTTKGIGLAPCAAVPEQSFQRVELTGGWFMLRSEATGTCVTAHGSYTFVLEPCATDDEAQQWRTEADTIGNVAIRHALTYSLLSANNPSELALFGSPSPAIWQKWEITAA